MVIRTGDNTVMGRIAALGKLNYFLPFFSDADKFASTYL
jgi:hypothetical protein